MPAADPALELILEQAQNTLNLQDLIAALRTATGVIPFVGAGLSQPFGFPQWGAFLERHAPTPRLAAAISARLTRGEYEEAAGDLQEALGALAFEDAIRRTFGGMNAAGRLPSAAVRVLPRLATGPVLTTNFDRVLEQVFEESGRRFDDVIAGAERAHVAQALHVNGRLLWKLHGDVRSRADRVLTHREYTEHYGHSDPSQVDWQKPLPSLFESLLIARPVLFLGCSLEQDRTVRILGAFAARHAGVGHYALLENPDDDEKRQQRARALSNVGIRPIWFPAGRFDLIAPFLEYLSDQQSGAERQAITSQRNRIEQGIHDERQALAGSAAGPAGPRRVVGQRPDSAEVFRGRGPVLRDVVEHLASDSARVVSVVGPIGIGKTEVAVRVMEGLEAGQAPGGVAAPAVGGVAYLGTRTGGITFEGIYVACAQLLGDDAGARLAQFWDAQIAISQRIERLLETIARQPRLYVVLLDHLGDLLDGNGRIIDDDLRQFVERCLATRSGLRLLVTSRVRLALPLDGARSERPVLLVDGLQAADGIAMLRDHDRGTGLRQLPDAELARVVARLHGVPRALEVFAGILAADDTETIDHLLEHFYDRQDVVEQVLKEGFTRLDEEAQRVVEALAVLAQPVPAAAIDFLLQPFVPGLDLPATLRRLSRGQMVRIVDRARGTWGLHPIDQDFAYARLPDGGRYSRQSLHHRAAEWYASVRTPRETWDSPGAVEPLLRGFDHLVKAELFDDAAAVLADLDSDALGKMGDAPRSLSMHLQIHGRVTAARLRMLELLGLAHVYRHIGPVEKAIAGYREVLEMARAQQNTAVEIEVLGWSGESSRRLGRLDEALVWAQQAVARSREIGDGVAMARWLGELAFTFCYRGELNEALAAAKEAHQAAIDARDVNWEALAVDALALVHLMRGDAQKAIAAAERAIAMYQQGTWQHTVMYVQNVVGLACLDLQQIDRAIDAFERGLAEAVASADARVEGMTQYNLAHAYRVKPDLPRALACAAHAVDRFEHTGGAEQAAASALRDSLKARAAGLDAAEARALIGAARASLMNPDLRHPRAFLPDAVRLAHDAGQAALATEAEQLLAQVSRRGAAAAST